MTNLPPFDAPRAKVRRAQTHIDALEQEFTSYAAQRPYRLTEHQRGVATRILDVRQFTELPIEIPLILGDAVHNLRAALDLMACDIVRLGGKSTKNVYFPFAYNKDGLEGQKGQISKKNFDRAPREAVDLLRKMKPYVGGNASLRAIHDLDITDKHELILPVATLGAARNITIGGGITFGGMRAGMPGAKITITNGIGAEVEVGEEIVELAFPQGSPLEHRPVIPTLHALAQLVSDTIEAFASLLLGDQANPDAAPVGDQ